MTIQQFIEAAVKGGYKKPEAFERSYFPMLGRYGNARIRSIGANPTIHELILDPCVWKAVGKAAGWNENYSYCSSSDETRGWGDYMHRMIDALAEGKTIEEYLETL